MKKHLFFLPLAVVILSIVGLLINISTTMIYSNLPMYMKNVLGASAKTTAFIDGLVEFISYITRIASGVVSDFMQNRKKVLVFGYGLAVLSKPLYLFASNVLVVLIAQAVNRFANGAIASPRDALVGDVASEKRRGASYGFMRSMKTIGSVFGAFLGMAILFTFSLNYEAPTGEDFILVFTVATVPAFIAFILLIFFVKEPKTHREMVDHEVMPECKEDRGILPFLSRHIKVLMAVIGFISMVVGISMFLAINNMNSTVEYSVYATLIIGTLFAILGIRHHETVLQTLLLSLAQIVLFPTFYLILDFIEPLSNLETFNNTTGAGLLILPALLIHFYLKNRTLKLIAQKSSFLISGLTGIVLLSKLHSTYHFDLDFVDFIKLPSVLISTFVLIGFILYGIHKFPEPKNFKAARQQLSLSYWFIIITAVVFEMAHFSESLLTWRANEAGLPPALGPTVMIMMNIGQFLVAYPLGYLSDRYNRRIILIIGFIFMILANICMGFGGKNVFIVMLGIFFWGAQMSTTVSIFLSLISDVVEKQVRATAFGIFYFVTGLSYLASSTLAGHLWDTYGYMYAFITSMSFAGLAILVAMVFLSPKFLHKTA